MNKLPMIYRKSMRNYFFTLGGVALIVFAIQILGIIFSLLGGGGAGVDLIQFVKDFSDTFIPISFMWLFIYYLFVPYAEFKLGMQNGQTRLKIWRSQLLGIVTITVVGWILYFILTGFNSITVASTFGILLSLFNGVFTCYAIGSGFALLPRKWKIIVAIALPTIFVTLLISLIRFLVSFWHPSAETLKTLNGIVYWQGSWVLFALIWLAIMAGLSYVFTMHLQLRRD